MTAAAAIEAAIGKALEFEARVKEVYASAVEQAHDPIGRRVFEVLADEEQGHIDYLEHRLGVLRETGKVLSGDLETALPSKVAIEAGVRKLEGHLATTKALESEAELLRKALRVEEETSAFYARMVKELPAEGRAFFAPFVTIEEGHVAIVQAELDAVTGLGFWFDYREFDLETG